MSELFEGDAVKHAPTDLQVQPKKEVVTVQSQDDRLLEKVLESGNIEVLERYIALRKSEEERQARIAFDEHFAAMQKDYVPIYKTKDVFNASGKKMYSYCPIDNIIDVYSPILAKHGFSFYWTEESLNENTKRLYCHICGYGHSRAGYFDADVKGENSFTNSNQQRGVSTSYGKRYSMMNALGLVAKGEDTDGSFTLVEVETAEPYKALITAAQTKQDLVNVFGRIWKETADNKHVQKLVQAAYEARKREIA